MSKAEGVKRGTWGRNTPPNGLVPSVVLWNPKYSQNVAKVVRLACCYGLSQLWWTGSRVDLDLSGRRRLPREERMKGYADVTLIQHDYPFDRFADAAPVAVEVRKNAENLCEFEHPENAVYVFGPEDGSLPKAALRHCHRFVVIPGRHCLNLATAVATVLYDRQFKRWSNGLEQLQFPGEFEQRGFEELPWGCDD